MPASNVIDDRARQEALRQQAETERVTAAEECRSSLSSRMADYRKQLNVKDFRTAAGTLRRCSVLLDDAKAKAMVKDAEVRAYVADMSNKDSSAASRLAAMEKLSRDFPEAAKKYEKDRAKLVALARAEEAERDLKPRFDRPVSIGDSDSAVRSTGWGAPSRVNRTTTAAGVREQWVYDGSRFLYFDNGRLTAIQE